MNDTQLDRAAAQGAASAARRAGVAALALLRGAGGASELLQAIDDLPKAAMTDQKTADTLATLMINAHLRGRAWMGAPRPTATAAASAGGGGRPRPAFKPYALKQALTYWRGKGARIKDDTFARLLDDAHAYAFTVSGAENIATIGALKGSLTQALEKGEAFSQWKKRAQTALDNVEKSRKEKGEDPLWRPSGARMQLIYRNAMGGAQAAGQWAAINENADIYPYLRYVAVGDNRVRPDHKELNALVARTDDPIWKTVFPPNGHNCRCGVSQMTERELQAKNLRPTSEIQMRRLNPAGKVDAGWARVPGENWRGLGAQTAARRSLMDGRSTPKSQRKMWDALIAPQRQWYNDDMRDFVQDAAEGARDKPRHPGGHLSAARGHASRILPPVSDPSVPLLTVFDGDIKDLTRAMKGAGQTHEAAVAALQEFFTEGIETAPRRMQGRGRALDVWAVEGGVVARRTDRGTGNLFVFLTSVGDLRDVE